MPRSQPINVWLAGDFCHAEFAPAVHWLGEVTHCIAAPLNLNGGEAAEPDAIVFFQSRPGSVTQPVVERLHRLAPLARLVLIAGPWCEGELRSGRPAHGISRLLWHQWQHRLPRELEPGSAGPSPSRARTLTPVERLLQSVPLAATRAACGARISIRTPRRNRLEALADLCTGMGFQVSPVQPAADAAICVVDGWEHLPPAGSEPSSPHPVILLLDWPRPSDLEQAEQRGITAVLGQPLLAADLLAAIEVLLPADTQAQAA